MFGFPWRFWATLAGILLLAALVFSWFPPRIKVAPAVLTFTDDQCLVDFSATNPGRWPTSTIFRVTVSNFRFGNKRPLTTGHNHRDLTVSFAPFETRQFHCVFAKSEVEGATLAWVETVGLTR